MIDALMLFLVVIFGLIIGSFLNCVVYRLGANQSFITGRSYCPHCKHTLSWYDLIPVFSFVLLGGACRYCHKKISIQYPLVEIVTAVVFLLLFQKLFAQDLVALAAMWYIAASLIVIFVYDFQTYIIPDKVLFPATVVAVLYQVFLRPDYLIRNALLAALLASGFFLIIFSISKGRWMGFGDVKLAVLLGLILGFPNILAALFLAFLSGAIVGVTSILLKGKGLKSEIPFAPFLIFGTLLAYFWGPQLIEWYTHFFIL